MGSFGIWNLELPVFTYDNGKITCKCRPFYMDMCTTKSFVQDIQAQLVVHAYIGVTNSNIEDDIW